MSTKLQYTDYLVQFLYRCITSKLDFSMHFNVLLNINTITFSFIQALKVYNFLSFCCLSFYFYRAPIVPKIWQLVFVHQNLIESFQGKNLAFVFYKNLIFELSFGIKFLTMQHVLVYQHHLDLVTYLEFLCISKMNINTFTVFSRHQDFSIFV